MGLQAGLARPLRPFRKHSLWVPGGSPASLYDTTVLADTPVAFWPLDEPSGTSAADLTGNGHTGTYTGGVTLGQAGPCSDGETAAQFDGTSGYVTIPDAVPLRITGNLSLEAWIHPTSLSTYQEIVSKDNSAATNMSYDYRLDAAVPPIINFLQGDGSFHQVAGETMTAAVWSHVVVTRQGTSITHYLNGTSAATGTMAGATPVDSGLAVMIGTRADLTLFFGGLIAKVAIYNYVLTGTQVSNHYNAR